MTDERARFNPFRVPGQQLNVPLCPWKHAEHADYYVQVGNTEAVFTEFTHEMGDLTTLRGDGQLILASGESGCGKTALINKCAWYIRQALKNQGGTGNIVDLRSSLMGRQLSVDDRLPLVADRALDELAGMGALSGGASKQLDRYRAQPDNLYRNLSYALRDGHVAIMLVPRSTLADEVMRYGALCRRNLLFLVEYLPENAEVDVVSKLEPWAPLLNLWLDELTAGDVHRFVNDRLQRHSSAGIYPQMRPEMIDSIGLKLRTVGQLQAFFGGVYEARLRSGTEYEESYYIEYKDFVDLLFEELRNSPGGRR